jgi:hypothetical protein
MVVFVFDFAVFCLYSVLCCYVLGKLSIISIPYHNIYSVLFSDSIKTLFLNIDVFDLVFHLSLTYLDHTSVPSATCTCSELCRLSISTSIYCLLITILTLQLLEGLLTNLHLLILLLWCLCWFLTI